MNNAGGRVVQRTFFILELDHDTYGPEDFFFDDLHIRLGIREDSWVDEIPLITAAVAAIMNRCTIFLAGIDVAHDALMHD